MKRSRTVLNEIIVTLDGRKLKLFKYNICGPKMTDEFNIVILGDKIVGKSTLTTKIIRNISISEYQRTIIKDSHVRHVLEISGKACRLVITDTSGSEDNRISYDHHISTGDGFFIVFSVDSFESYKAAIALKERIERRRAGEKVPMLLVGNKTDLGTCEDLKGPLRARLLANLYGVPYVGTSAKSGVGVREAYITLIVIDDIACKFTQRTRGL